MHRYPGGQFPYSAFFWPALAAASAGEVASSWAALFLGFSGDADGRQTPQEPEGATPGRITLELRAVRLRDFTMAQSGVPTLLCTPLALHGAAIADLAAGHGLVAALRDAGIGRLFMADWRSASPDMRFLGIDEYLADLNVLVDRVGGLGLPFLWEMRSNFHGLGDCPPIESLATPTTSLSLRGAAREP